MESGNKTLYQKLLTIQQKINGLKKEKEQLIVKKNGLMLTIGK